LDTPSHRSASCSTELPALNLPEALRFHCERSCKAPEKSGEESQGSRLWQAVSKALPCVRMTPCISLARIPEKEEGYWAGEEDNDALLAKHTKVLLRTRGARYRVAQRGLSR